MSKKLFSLLVVVLTGCLALAAGKLTNEQYWAATGLSGDDLQKLPYFQQQYCAFSLPDFRGCIAGITSLTSYAKPQLILVPRSVVGNATIEKDFGPLVFIKAPPKTDSVEILGLYKFWQKENARRKKLDSAIADLFNSASKNSANFSQIMMFARSMGLTDSAKEASRVAAALNAHAIKAVDPHSHFDAVDALIAQSNDSGEQFFGIGAILGVVGGRLIVQSPIEGGPALKAGLRANDAILKINDEPVENIDVTESADKVRGPLGTAVTLRVLRDGKQFDVAIKRGEINITNLSDKLLTSDSGKKIGYLKLGNFMDKNACGQMKTMIIDLEKNGAQDLILDLRKNGGGLLDQGVCISELFVGKKVIGHVKNLTSNTMKDMQSGNGDKVTDLPLIILIDAGSASASEVVSGALQDYGRAWLLGERSFGKATAQIPLRVSFSNVIVFFKTVERFYQPTGRTNQIQGLIPDFTVPSKPDATAEDRFALREGDLFPNALEAIGKPWKQPRPKDVAEIKSCMAKTGTARKSWKAHQQDAMPADYQLFAAEDAANCLPVQNLKLVSSEIRK